MSISAQHFLLVVRTVTAFTSCHVCDYEDALQSADHFLVAGFNVFISLMLHPCQYAGGYVKFSGFLNSDRLRHVRDRSSTCK
jgi:hypothetical protein